MWELILSLVVSAALVFAFRLVRKKIDGKAMQALLCMVIAVAIVVTVCYAGMSLIILLV